MKLLTEEQLRQLLTEAWEHGYVYRQRNGGRTPEKEFLQDRDGAVNQLAEKAGVA